MNHRSGRIPSVRSHSPRRFALRRGRGRWRVLSALPAIQIALALVMMMGMAMTMKTVIGAESDPEGWRVGVGRACITPLEPIWMSGYASRNRPAERTRMDLWSKALMFEDDAGGRSVMVTLDLVGIDRQTSVEICRAIMSEHQLDRAGIVLAVSHTHTGPVVGANLRPVYFMPPEQWELVMEYRNVLVRQVLRSVRAAADSLGPASVAWGNGHATFAVNRRNNRESAVPELRERGGLRGPVDHDVPVLRVTRPDGEVVAVAFGYACHATVLGDYEWSGDYPGYAQDAYESMHPGVTALFWAGCGADINPLPRREVALAEAYGERLARAADAVVASEMSEIRGPLRTVYTEIPLPFERLPSEADLIEETRSTNRYIAHRARLLLQSIRDERPLRPDYPYPIGVWRWGGDLTWITLGGEVVVDYSLRFKKEFGSSCWVAGYCHDVMAYIPSRRVWEEGGYEGATAMIYYGLPSRWAGDVEDRIVEAVRESMDKVGR